MTIYRSHLPDRVVPYMNAYSFVVSNPNETSDSHPVLFDALTKQVIRYGEWKRDTRRWATGLQSIGFKRGDVLALFSFNQVDYSITMYGPILLGAITTTVNSAYTADELAYQLTDAGATVLVTHPELLSIAIAGAQKAGLAKDRIFLYGDQTVQGFRPYKTLMPPISTPEHQLAQVLVLDSQDAKDTTALICYSSGTTGRSKGVELSHSNINVNALQVSSFDGDIPAHENVSLSVLPMYHMYSVMVHLICGMYNGIPNIVLQKFNLEDFLRAIQDYKIKTLNLVPPQVLMLVKSPLVEKYDLSHIRHVMAGAAPCSKELIVALLARFPQIAFRQAYGMSELSPATHIGLYETMVHGSAGRVLPNQEVRVVAPDTCRDVLPGEPGEVWVRGPNVMKGYRNNEKATRDTIDAEGWLHTGDIAIVDADENFFVVDRLKELIKYKGFQVAPADLEAILLTHPDILDTAVIGIEDKEQATEVPLAFVVKNETTASGRTLKEQDIVDYVASKVAAHKRLRGGVRFIDAIPKTASGKLLRKHLRVLAQNPKAKL
ncbi:putative fatty-acid--CoA ligase FadD10 [Mortierella sp. GBA30]|nr:putative fatty-acid--CoA ligase FadD10 [Mortierella sp. GBA30]